MRGGRAHTHRDRRRAPNEPRHSARRQAAWRRDLRTRTHSICISAEVYCAPRTCKTLAMVGLFPNWINACHCSARGAAVFGTCASAPAGTGKAKAIARDWQAGRRTICRVFSAEFFPCFRRTSFEWSKRERRGGKRWPRESHPPSNHQGAPFHTGTDVVPGERGTKHPLFRREELWMDRARCRRTRQSRSADSPQTEREEEVWSRRPEGTHHHQTHHDGFSL